MHITNVFMHNDTIYESTDSMSPLFLEKWLVLHLVCELLRCLALTMHAPCCGTSHTCSFLQPQQEACMVALSANEPITAFAGNCY
jgi:hypothetical protein